MADLPTPPEVLVASSGLVLPDMNMPMLNGLEFLEELAPAAQRPVAAVLQQPLTQEAWARGLQAHFPGLAPAACFGCQGAPIARLA